MLTVERDMASVLLVEDESEIRSMLCDMLIDDGHHVIEADCGDTAARIIDQAPDIDILVTDVRMPGHLNGLALGQHFHKSYSCSPILYFTGSPETLNHVPMRQGVEIVLSKPSGLVALAATVRTLLA